MKPDHSSRTALTMVRWMVIGLLSSWHLYGYAAENDDEARTTEAAAATDESQSQDSEDSEDDGGFTPTEEISEDFAVSFPVDI